MSLKSHLEIFCGAGDSGVGASGKVVFSLGVRIAEQIWREAGGRGCGRRRKDEVGAEGRII